jgi:WD40 repeat protein
VQVKVWNTTSGFCFVTFHEHTAGVTGVSFTSNGQVILSSSLDGTVRAFDLNRFVALNLSICSSSSIVGRFIKILSHPKVNYSNIDKILVKIFTRI